MAAGHDPPGLAQRFPPLFTAFHRSSPIDDTTNMDMTTNQDEAPQLSKTQRKRAMEDLQALGEALVVLPAERLGRIEMPETLREAVREARGMTRHDEARRRQMQYIGRLMRDIDPEPMRAALAEIRGESARATANLHKLEKLRDDLLADEKILHQIAQEHPGADLQQLRALRRAALKEQTQNKPPRNYRALFQMLKALTDSPADDVPAA